MWKRSPEADIERSCVIVDGRHTRAELPSCDGMMVSLLFELGKGLPNPLRCEGLLLG